ncbi:putative F420-dependent oxidoreductase [Haloactinospora alba]|uniref:Putative F420-dependent oxidoreductase n=1 Tax=Haloactinospora alba TaxID=405555 RepID=A0A543N9Y4_9ACTN|nr:TIGR03619 family F420-dependent LLM class oxidoreductase [Haloactinospora alba]TQN28619.1 putative F420-dependent oxidoreductase [Haloactinospora alba]
MRIGFTLPQMGALAHETHDVARFAREAERIGADSLWVGDRLLGPVNPSVGYFGSDSIPEEFHAVLDPFALMAVAATVTERVSVGANVLNAPWYAPAVLARSLTTIDRLSGGRLLPGFGTGWSPEEYQAAGVPMKERGARLDECLDALEVLWSENPAQYEGKHWRVPATHSDLKPVQRPRPPVYLGAFAPAAMQRVARRADGWLPVVAPGTGPFDPTAITAPMADIRTRASEAGRDPAELGMVLRVYPTATASVDEIAEALVRAEREAGVDHAFVEMMNVATEVDGALELAERVLDTARA